MPKMVMVQRMPHTITFEGKNYGPSQTPIQVPEALAAALGLPVTPDQAIQTAHEKNASQELEASRTLAGQYQENYQKLETLLQPHMGQGETPESALQDLLAFVNKSRDIFLPVAGDGGKEESGLEAMQRIVNERHFLRTETKRLQDTIDVGKTANERLMQEKAALQVKLTEAEETNLEYLEYVGELLPQGFPERKLLMTEGYITVRHVQEATDQELKDIDGIADKRLEAIRKVAPYTPAEEPLTDKTPAPQTSRAE